MDKKYIGIFIKTTIIAVAALVLNLLIYLIPGPAKQQALFIYPLPLIYLFFFVFSVIILAVLINVSKKNANQLGYVFLFLTGVKMAASYFFAKPIISQTIDTPTEKVNFFAVFILFLAIEAYFTARLLNNKQ